MRRGRASDAVEITREAVAVARTADDASLFAKLLFWHTMALGDSGADTREGMQEVMRLYREAGDRIGVGHVLEQIGLAELTAGNIATAREHLEEAARLGDELGIAESKLSVWLNLGLAALLDGDNRQARALFTDVLPLARDTEKTAIPYALLGPALTTTADDPEQAARLHGTVDRLLAESGMGFEPLEARLRQQDHQRLKSYSVTHGSSRPSKPDAPGRSTS
jgi:tetratricopeptide (TPR) repeat protein